MLKLNVGAVAATTFVALSLAGMDVLAADAPSQNARDLKDNTCKDIMRLSGQDRDVALALAHGYVLGRKGTTKFEVDALAKITEKFVEHCLDNPKENALAAFEALAR